MRELYNLFIFTILKRSEERDAISLLKCKLAIEVTEIYLCQASNKVDGTAWAMIINVRVHEIHKLCPTIDI
jgi:hypothetical protein